MRMQVNFRKIEGVEEFSKFIASRSLTNINPDKRWFLFVHGILVNWAKFLVPNTCFLIGIVFSSDSTGRIANAVLAVLASLMLCWIFIFKAKELLSQYKAGYDASIIVTLNTIKAIRERKMEWVVIDRSSLRFFNAQRILHINNVYFSLNEKKVISRGAVFDVLSIVSQAEKSDAYLITISSESMSKLYP
jgi:hypothetical protein